MKEAADKEETDKKESGRELRNKKAIYKNKRKTGG